NASRVAGPTQPTAPDAGLIEEHVDEQRLTIVDPATGAARQVSPPDMYVYEYDWSPDSRSFALTAAHGSGDNNWFVAQLYTMSAETGVLKSLLKPTAQIAEPHWSPDGKQIAFVGGLMSDEGVTGGDIYTVAASGGDAKNMTPGMKASASQIAWTASANQIIFAEHVDGGAGVATLDLSDKSVKTLWTGAETISRTGGVGLSLSRDGQTSAVVRHSFEHPPEVWAGPLGEWRQITNINAPLRPGSYGQGEEFTRANVKDFGHGDLHDILAGVDEVVKTAPVDANRIGIAGWSYGGFMTMWAVTQTTRFRAAAAGAGIANWQSYYGENQIDQWMIPFFGASVYEDPSVYARSSPINYIKRVKTPTLVLVGDRDAECPAPQSYEFWHALKTLGVETQFVVYPGEGHAISKTADRRDALLRAANWFDAHLK